MNIGLNIGPITMTSREKFRREKRKNKSDMTVISESFSYS